MDPIPPRAGGRSGGKGKPPGVGASIRCPRGFPILACPRILACELPGGLG